MRECTYKFSVFVLLLLLCISIRSVNAQGIDALDSSKSASVKPRQKDTSTTKPVVRHSPAKAAMYSAIFPGLGQAYNHKYWKMPIIYVGVGVITYFIISNQQEFNMYNTALKTYTNTGVIPPAFSVYSNTDLVSLVQYYHKDRDLSIIVLAGLYLLNIVDAEVDAQLFTFNVSDDISMHWSPNLNVSPVYNTALISPGLSLTLKLK